MIDYRDIDEIELTPEILQEKRAAQKRYERIIQNAASERKMGQLEESAYAAVKSAAMQTYYNAGIGKWLLPPLTPEERMKARIDACLQAVNLLRSREGLPDMTMDEFRSTVLQEGAK
ncbi:MAG: hypothetical protein PHN90_03620 [Methanothrix sp.]|nr:hypothetical protein [Methanothrix sp.]